MEQETRLGTKPVGAPVVGLGASAGGIEALAEFFDATPPDSGLAFVVVLHLVLLDMNIHGRNTLVVAEELASRSVPSLVVTGYGAGDADPPVINAAPRVQKPFTEELLGQRMAEVFGAARRRREPGP